MKYYLIILVFFHSTILSSQTNDSPIDIIEADSTWGKEKIRFPLHFAPQIDYNGYEDIRFHKNWAKEGNAGFWSYVMAWNINSKTTFDGEQLEQYMQYYYDGLMKVVNKDSTLILPKTKALFIKDQNAKKFSEYFGKIQLFDAFITKKGFILHVKVTQYYCDSLKRYFILIKCSPEPFEHVIWEELNNVALKPKLCD